MSLELRDLTKSYGDVEAVRALSLSCPTGQMLGLLGPSGCGKSTTLKMIAGIEEVTTGRILFSGREVQTLPPGARDIAMVFEDYALYAHLTVFENVAFPLRVRGLPGGEVAEKVGAILRLLRLDGIAGEKVRNPEVIVFDEPLSHLDADQKVELRTEIKRLQQLQGLTSILVTHDQTEAIAMCDVIAVMNAGALQQVGPPQELYDRPVNTFVAQFIGEPPMNLLAARLDPGAAGPVLSGPDWRLPLSGAAAGLPLGAVTAGLRPEALELLGDDPADGRAVLAGKVRFREHRGDTDVLLVALDAAGPDGAEIRVFADLPGPCPLREGDRVRLGIDGSGLSLFDRDTGQNLQAVPAPAREAAA